MPNRTRSIAAAILAVVAFLWHFKAISEVTKQSPPGMFPIVPAVVTTGAAVLALYWWGKAKADEEEH